MWHVNCNNMILVFWLYDWYAWVC